MAWDEISPRPRFRESDGYRALVRADVQHPTFCRRVDRVKPLPMPSRPQKRPSNGSPKPARGRKITPTGWPKLMVAG